MITERVPIDDLDDPRVAMYRHLKETNLTRRGDQFVVEGLKLFERLVASRFPVASVLVSDRSEPLIAGRVPEGTILFVASHAKVERLVGFNLHRGILACGYRRPWPRFDALARTAGPRASVVICPKLDNPENLGAIVRIADVFGVLGVVVGPRCPDPLSRRVLRVSMGTALRVPVVIPDDLENALERLRSRHGFRLAATVCDPRAEPVDRFDPEGRVAVLLGVEGHGLDPEWVARCDHRITIPMRPGAESLNVAVAAGIVLHHLMRPARAAGL